MSIYQQIIEGIFFNNYQSGLQEFEFERSEILDVAIQLNLEPPKNLGDAIYSVRYRTQLPTSVLDTQPNGMEWIIEGAGRARYRFKLVPRNRIVPDEHIEVVDIPDSTPELISMYSLDDEQALLAKVRYNRLIDIFLGLTTYSMQNHLRTSVKGVGQIEIDELYIGIDSNGYHYIIPVQAKGGNDKLSVIQTSNDIRFCQQKFPGLPTRAISTQFLASEVIVLFELELQEAGLEVVKEKHYQLIRT
jgi:hypothetical protein